MGVTLKAVSADYGYAREQDDYIGEIYLSTDTGHGKFRTFRNNLIKWATDNKADDMSVLVNNEILPSNDSPLRPTHEDEEYLDYCYYDENFSICMTPDDAALETRQKEDFVKYMEKLDFLKENYPKLYTIYPFAYHCDCEGEMPFKQCEQVLPLIKEFHEFDNRSYGYSAWEYNFVEDFIKILEEVVAHKGKLLFC
jgi:hypothetical protein